MALIPIKVVATTVYQVSPEDYIDAWKDHRLELGEIGEDEDPGEPSQEFVLAAFTNEVEEGVIDTDDLLADATFDVELMTP